MLLGLCLTQTIQYLVVSEILARLRQACFYVHLLIFLLTAESLQSTYTQKVNKSRILKYVKNNKGSGISQESL